MKNTVLKHLIALQVLKDERGQDMVEYALLAGFIAVAAGAIFPPASDSISVIFSRLASIAEQANT